MFVRGSRCAALRCCGSPASSQVTGPPFARLEREDGRGTVDTDNYWWEAQWRTRNAMREEAECEKKQGLGVADEQPSGLSHPSCSRVHGPIRPPRASLSGLASAWPGRAAGCPLPHASRFKWWTSTRSKEGSSCCACTRTRSSLRLLAFGRSCGKTRFSLPLFSVLC